MISNRRSTFESLRQWIIDARSLASAELIIVLVGNKIDDEDHREVQYDEASEFAEENGKEALGMHSCT